MKIQSFSFCVVGPGRVGSSLALALIEKGWRCSSLVVGKHTRSNLNILKKHFDGVPIVGSVSSLKGRFDLVFITVSDDMIPHVAEELSRNRKLDFENVIVLHASGIIPVSVLNPLKSAGASVGAFHPVSSFAGPFSPGSAAGIYYDFFGGKRARGLARKLADELSSKVVFLHSERERELLHVASVIVSNFTVVGMRTAEKLVSGTDSRNEAKLLFEGLLRSTISNLSLKDGASSLTGPLARGDVDVIARHLKALESDPALLQFYRSASILGVDLLMESVRTPARRRKLSEIRKLLEG